MNNKLLAVVKQIVAEQGEGILDEPRRIASFFADLAQDIPKPQKSAFVKCLEYESAQMLKNAAEPERETCKQQLVQKLHNEEGLDLKLCKETFELLTAALFEKKQKKVYCTNCGKELQEGWKVCPYCSTQGADDISDAVDVREAADKEAAGSTVENYPVDNAVSQTQAEPPTPAQSNESAGEDARLKEELESARSNLVTANSKNSLLEKELKSKKSGLVAAVVIGLICVAVSVIIGVLSYFDMKSSYYSMVYQYNQEKSKYDKLLAHWKIDVTSIKAGNWNNDDWLTKPGEPLSADQMRFFRPVITYNSTISEEVTFFVKIINPDGQLSSTASISPRGFSNSTTTQINQGSDQSLDLGGWGKSENSTYPAGTYTVEIWYNNACLRSEKITIGP